MVESDIYLPPWHPFAQEAWAILLSPLVAVVLILLVAVHRRRLASCLAIGGILISFACSLSLFFHALLDGHAIPIESAVSWVALPGLTVGFGVLIDHLSLLMALVVTGVGSAIFIYSTAYMAKDEAYSRYFGMLSLFAFSMLTIVLATNWIQLFIGWELVGFCSYALIGHWYAKPSAAEAGKKAFMVNRVADVGFLLGVLALWAILPVERTFDFNTLKEQLPLLVQTGVVPGAALSLIGLLLFCGPIGKSAQFPLHVWLPDAMEGPTPVSALIHAATMVAAGVYMLCRTFWLFELTPSVLTTITWVGAVTAFLAACLALVECDLKRMLAYSTLSQLGYMVMALGLGGAIAGMYHLTTHAFFKALLFLAAGSVIHGTHEQDIRNLGGLWHSMRWTSLAFLIGGLALCGFPGLSGFFSKDAILVLAHEHSPAAFWLALLTAGLTAFYIARAWCIAFMGQGRAHGQESPLVMLIPLGLLAVLSIVAGYVGIPQFMSRQFPHVEAHEASGYVVAALSIAVVAAGLTLAWLIYRRRLIVAPQLVQALALPYSFLQRRYYIDELYDWYVAVIQQRLIAGACAWFERVIIIGLGVNGIARLTRKLGGVLRLCQTGTVQTYVLGFLIGIACFLSVALQR